MISLYWWLKYKWRRYLAMRTLLFASRLTLSLTITFLQIRYIKVHTATRWTIGHDLVLLCFKDLMNVTEKLQFIDQRFDTPVWCLHQESLKFVLPSSKKLSFNLSSPHPGQYTNCTPSPGHPPSGWTQKLFFKFFRLLCVGNLKWPKNYVWVNHYSPRKGTYFNWNMNN